MNEENEKPNITRSFSVSGMPLSQYLRWKKDCIDNYGDCHWLKIWADHEAATMLKNLVSMFDEVHRRIDELEEVLNQPREKEERVNTFRKEEEDG